MREKGKKGQRRRSEVYSCGVGMGNPGSWAASKDRVGEKQRTPKSKGKIKDDFRSKFVASRRRLSR